MKTCQQRLRQHSAKLGIAIHENLGAIESFEKTPTGVQMIFSKDGHRNGAEATVVVAVGWAAQTAGLCLATAGVESDHRGCVKLDGYGRTSARISSRRGMSPVA